MASPSVTCYPQPGKQKSRRLCDAFAAGAGGVVVETSGRSGLQPGPAAFYGTLGIEPLYRQAIAGGRDWYYCDNAYFDKARQVYFRVEKNALQATKPSAPDWIRAGRLELGIQPWQRGGRHMLVVEQSDYFMREVVGWPGGASAWLQHVLETLHKHTDRQIVVRHWSRDKDERARSLKADLRGAWALVTHMSAAANEALIAGVPVFVTGPCAALPMGLSQLESIESPRMADGRYEWAAGLAGMQWTEEEMRDGTAWRSLNAA